MVPVEWPIAAPSDDGGLVPARVVGSGRLPVVRLDFFLDPAARLTEQERSLMTAMLCDLVSSVTDEFTAILADAEPANDDGDSLVDRLWAAGLLDIPDLISVLLRRAEQERINSAIRQARGAGKARLAQSLVSDDDADISAAAMALILARSRRRDRFDGPRLSFDDVSAEAASCLVSAIAAALRSDLARRLGTAVADDRLSDASRSLLSAHDEGKRLEARLFDLVHALDRAGRLDSQFLREAADEGDIPVLVEALARRAGVGFEPAWDCFTGSGGRLSLLLRMAKVSRDFAGEIVAGVAEVMGQRAEVEIHAFDELLDSEVESARRWLRLDHAYRNAIDTLSANRGQRSL